MRERWLPVLLLLALSAPLVACGDDDESDESAESDEAPEAENNLAAAQQGEMDPLAEALAAQQPEPIPAPEDVAAPPEDAERTESGLAFKVLEEGTGEEHPGEYSAVRVNYTGWTTDGQMFDSSYSRGEPATLDLARVIPGWKEGIQLMVEGEKRRLWIPEELAYGGRPGAPAGMLVFDVELLAFEDGPEPPETPEDVARAPRNAERTESGLASRVLEEGTGTEHPTMDTIVQIHFTGWTTDGEMIDSSLRRGRPATFPLSAATMEGWKEGIQLMVEGEKRRFWIPEDLANTGQPGGPEGTLVFDIELVRMMEAPPGMPGMPGMPPGAGGRPPPGAGGRPPGAPPASMPMAR